MLTKVRDTVTDTVVKLFYVSRSTTGEDLLILIYQNYRVNGL